MTELELTQVFKQAAEIAKVVPERMQEAAFHRALDALLGGNRVVQVRRTSEPAGTERVKGADSPPRAKVSNEKRVAGRVGPKAALEELVSSDFFQTAKTIGQIKRFLESKKGHKYRTTDLSPALVRLLRENVLDRDTNPEGQYEYKKRQGNA